MTNPSAELTPNSAHFDEWRLKMILERARNRSADRGRPVLASATDRVEAIDPLLAIERVRRAAHDGEIPRELVAEGCMYWAHPRDGLAMAGVGAAVAFTPAGKERFAVVDKAWQSLLADSVAGSEHASPVMMGGFSFNAHGPTSSKWEEFGATWMFVPRMSIETRGEVHQITLSAMVSAESDLEKLRDELIALRNAADTDFRKYPVGFRPDEPLVLSEPRSRAEWNALVSAAVSRIRQGDFEKVVLAREVAAIAANDVDAVATLRQLRAGHPDAFVFGAWRGDRVFVGASPERLVSVHGRDVKASSLAGTARRGATEAEDGLLATQLLTNPKERAEHAAVKDSLVEKLAGLCEDVVASPEPNLLTLPHLHHLHTEVCGRLRAGCSLLDVVAMLHPTPAVGGTPRDAALAFINGNEFLDRGWYAAPVGWIGRDAGEFAVALRCALLAGNHATLYAGCGIVEGSEPALEYAESQLKLRPVRLAIEAALAEDN
ncbi:MAG: isochorismate synthase [Gemmatimonadaceae bacterium]